MPDQVWEFADDVRQKLNWIAPILTIGLSILYYLMFEIWLPYGYNYYGGTLDIFYLIYAPVYYFFIRMAPPIDVYAITSMVIGISAGVLYFATVFKGVANNKLRIFPEHIMMLIVSIMASWGSWWSSIIMFSQFLLVWFLGSYPIWSPA
jgi:hypothetical protein